ncbi:MAG: four helix bundle protein [Opitutae bacterium]|nr:four helix bundle protein [Opitutae bacterium]
MKNYHDLNVWKSSHALTIEIYRLTKAFPKEELFGLTSQLRRAASSIPANIAEGCGREGDAELKRFLNIALGSACEADYFVLLAGELGYLDSDSHSALAEKFVQLRRQLGAFIQKLKDDNNRR